MNVWEDNGTDKILHIASSDYHFGLKLSRLESSNAYLVKVGNFVRGNFIPDYETYVNADSFEEAKVKAVSKINSSYISPIFSKYYHIKYGLEQVESLCKSNG